MSEMERQSGEKEALIFEKRRKEKEDRKKKFEEQIEMWKSGKILELYPHYYLEDDQPNVWLRIKSGISAFIWLMIMLVIIGVFCLY